MRKFRVLLVGVGCLALSALSWIPQAIEAARSPGEKDFGVGILAALAMMISIVFVPLGVGSVIAGLVKVIRRRRMREFSNP